MAVKPANSLMPSKGNQAAERQTKPTFAAFMKAPSVLKNIESTLGSASKRQTFVSSLVSSVATNSALRNCDPSSIVSAALLGESLNLPPSPQLGYYYMVPYKQKAKREKVGNAWIETEPAKTVATFQLGYKGYIQLAQRSGKYRRLTVVPIHENQFLAWDPLAEKLEYNTNLDTDESPIVGYYAFFELVNGFRKAMYWTKEKMIRHADRYSAAFTAAGYQLILEHKVPDQDMWKYSSFWYKDFDAMACKTMLRQLLSKWGPMSVEMARAYEGDYTATDLDSSRTIRIEEAEVVEETEFTAIDPAETELSALPDHEGDTAAGEDSAQSD